MTMSPHQLLGASPERLDSRVVQWWIQRRGPRVERLIDECVNHADAARALAQDSEARDELDQIQLAFEELRQTLDGARRPGAHDPRDIRHLMRNLLQRVTLHTHLAEASATEHGDELLVDQLRRLGTTAAALIPHADALHEAALRDEAAGRQRRRTRADAPKGTILLLEQGAVPVALLHRMLEHEGHEVHEAPLSEDSSTYDLLIADVSDGISDALRARLQGTRQAALAVVGKASEERVAACLEAGFSDVVGKPFTAQDLRTRIELLLTRRKTHDLREALREATARADELQTLALPGDMASELEELGSVAPRDLSRATLLTATLPDFDLWAADRPTEMALSVYERVHLHMSQAAHETGLSVLPTASTDLLVLGGFANDPLDSVARAAETGLRWLDIVRREAPWLPLAVCLHQGAVTLAPIGRPAVRCVLWGSGLATLRGLRRAARPGLFLATQAAAARCPSTLRRHPFGRVRVDDLHSTMVMSLTRNPTGSDTD